MRGNGALRAFTGWRPWTVRQEPAQPDDLEAASLSRRESRQRRLNVLLRRGVPLWNEEPECCDGCGRELLPGERALLLRRSDELLLACPLCAEHMLDQGCLRAVPGVEEGSAHTRSYAG